MHQPPEVRFLVNASPWPRRVLGMVFMLAVLQVFWFALVSPTLTWRTVAVGTSLLAAVGMAWAWTQRPASGSLHWDGAQWQWSGFPVGACTLQQHLDFQTLMLVSLHHPSGPPVWLWLQRSTQPFQWLALRRAVVHTAFPEQVHRTGGAASAHRATTL